MKSLTVIILLATALCVKAATRCYDNLGCYNSGILHALPQDPNHVRTQFRISCRNKTDDIIIEATSDETTKRRQLDASCFEVDKLTKFGIHGFNDRGSATWMKEMRDLLLKKDDYNVILVDWHHGARFPYEQAVANTYMVAKQLANFIGHLERVHGVSPDLIHLIGHSLGAQIAGNCGSDLTPSRVARITGLDPAEPYYGNFDDDARLDSSDAIFVDVIHTDGEQFTGLRGYGSLRPQGDVDFFPNGGQKQPGCDVSEDARMLLGQKTPDTFACSHARAYELFLQSLRVTPCELSANACTSWRDFNEGKCNNCSTAECQPMGIDTVGKGEFYSSTSHEGPYCGQSYKIEVHLAHLQSHAYGRIFLQLIGSNKESEMIDFTRANRHYHSAETESHLVTTTSGLDELLKVKFVFEKGSGLSSLGTADILIVEDILVTPLDSQKSWKFCSANGPVEISEGTKTNYLLNVCP